MFTWVCKIARDKGFNVRRVHLNLGSIGTFPSPPDIPEEKALSIREALSICYGRLSAEVRYVLEMQHDGVSNEEIAQGLNIEVGTVKRRARGGRDCLKVCLRKLRVRLTMNSELTKESFEELLPA